MRNRLDLKAQWKHVGVQSRLDDLIQIDVVRLKMRESLSEKICDAAQRLQVVGDAQVVQ